MFDAIVLAGGSARRLGGADKPGLVLHGRTLLDHVLLAVAQAERVVVVGPLRTTVVPVSWCRESPPGGGPVAALAAGLDHTLADVVVVLAADLPYVAPAVPVLLASADADVAVLSDPDGRVHHLAAAWRRAALEAALAAIGDPAGAAARSLLAGMRVSYVEDRGGWARDCDTWDDLAAARSVTTSRGE